MIELVCWDICPDQNQMLLPSYVKNAMGVVYVYDVTKRESFEQLQHYRDLIIENQNTQKFSELLIGNKIDLQKFREVSEEEGY